jgi:hypothetical protein
MANIGPALAVTQVPVWDGAKYVPGNVVTNIVDGLQAQAVAIPVTVRSFGLVVFGNNTGSASMWNNGWSTVVSPGSSVATLFTRNDVYRERPWTGAQSSALANSVAFAVNNVAVSKTIWLSSTANCGGFYWKGAFGTSSTTIDPIANQSTFMGWRNSVTAPAGGTLPSTFIDCLGVGWDSGDANLQIMVNDGAGTCTKIDLGASFAIGAKLGVYVEFYCSPGSTTITYRITGLPGTGALATGTISANTPTINQDMTWQAYTTNGATASIAVTVWGSQYVEAF